MSNSRWAAILVSLVAILFVAGCAIGTGATGQKSINSSSWHGRLSVRVAAEAGPADAPWQSFGAAFELQGDAQQGELLLLTPLGSTAAAVRWTPAGAVLAAGGKTKTFQNLEHLMAHLLGTALPVPALFAWLAGDEASAEGWQVDQTLRGEGKITARRLHPAPAAELRLILEN